MSFDEEDTLFLMDIGFTKNQAKLYLSLLKQGKAEGRTLAKLSGAPKSVIYRTLDELQRMGLVEKEITVPSKFKATPLKQGLQIIMNNRLEHYRKNRERTEQFLLRKQNAGQEENEEQEYRLVAYEGKERIRQVIKLQHDKAHISMDILSTLQRWLQIIECCHENYEKALARNVKYRVVIDSQKDKNVFPEEVRKIVANPNFELKIAYNPLDNNLGICDRKEATFNFYPSKTLKESPIIWTNNPSFITMAQDHFEKAWKVARTYKVDK